MPFLRIAVLFVACCTALGAAARSAELRVFSTDDGDRTYRVYRPASLAHKDLVPLVVMLHPALGSSLESERTYHWDATADEHGFVVLYPDGIDHTWNAGDCCDPAKRKGINDTAFLSALIVHVRSTEGIDPDRVYVTGLSNGAMMAYHLVCSSSLAVAAIGPVAGTLEDPCANPNPTSVYAIHGLDDHNVPFHGGVPTEGLERAPRLAVPDAIALWRHIDDCSTPTSTTDGPVTTESSHCAEGRAVDLTTIAGAGHQWPGSEPTSSLAAKILHLDPPSQAIDATERLWTFFSAHHM